MERGQNELEDALDTLSIYDYVHGKIDDGTEFEELGLQRFQTYDQWQAYMTQRIIESLRSYSHSRSLSRHESG